MCHNVDEANHQRHPLEQEFYFPGHDKSIPTYTYGYVPGEEKAAVVLLHDLFGPGAFYRELARRLAEHGFAVLLPNLFHREGELKEQTLEAAQERARHHNLATALHDLLALTDLLHQEQRKIGLLGFCLGGRYALFATAHIPQIAACAVYYPTLIVESQEHQPIADVSKLHAPVRGFFGARDHRVAVEAVRAYAEEARKHQKALEFTIYPDVGHAFMTFAADEEGSAASQESWPHLLTFFKKHL